MYRADRQTAAAPLAALWAAVRAGTPYLGLHGAAFTVQQGSGGPAAIGARYEEPHLRQQPLSVRIADSGHPDYRWRGVLYHRGRAISPDAARTIRAARAGVVLRLRPQPSDAPRYARRRGRLAVALHQAAGRRTDTHQRPWARPTGVDPPRLSPGSLCRPWPGCWLPPADDRLSCPVAWLAACAAMTVWTAHAGMTGAGGDTGNVSGFPPGAYRCPTQQRTRPGGAHMSKDSSKKYAAGLLRQHRRSER